MSEEYECGVCGRDGGPVEGCATCHGNQRHRQAKQYSLSELRSGRVQDPRGGRVKPKTDDPGWTGHNSNG
jgi:hypothetical protein